jgi:hypothetical protein
MRTNQELRELHEIADPVVGIRRNVGVLPISSVGIATGYGLDDQVSIPDIGTRFFSSPKCPERVWGPFNEYRRVKVTTELHLVTPPYVFMTCCSINGRDNFNFTCNVPRM